jgi:hypothetical protein
MAGFPATTVLRNNPVTLGRNGGIGQNGYVLTGRGTPNAPVAVPANPFTPYDTPVAEPEGIGAADFGRSVTSPGAGGLLQAALQQALNAQFLRSGRNAAARNDRALFGATGISRIAAGLRKGKGLSAFGSGNKTSGSSESMF